MEKWLIPWSLITKPRVIYIPHFEISHLAMGHFKMWFIAQNALQREWGNFPFANWNGICWGLPLQLVQLIKIHFLPHLESFMLERKFEKKFLKKSPIQHPNGVLPICKLPFPNGSYRNGVCRALWVKSWASTYICLVNRPQKSNRGKFWICLDTAQSALQTPLR